MLGLVDGQVVEVEPVLTVGEYRLAAAKPDRHGRGRLYLYFDGTILQTGRTFYAMKKEGQVTINGRTGEYELGKGAKATFRCVFAGQHKEVEVKA